MKRLELDLKKTSADCASVLGDRFHLGILAESDTATLISSTILGVINKIICPESGLKMSLTGDKKLLIDKKEGKNDAKVGYRVYLRMCYDDDSYDVEKFVTVDKKFAQRWCFKFNKIIQDNHVRAIDYSFKRSDSKKPLWYDLLTLNLYPPKARYKEIEIR